jgi:hypothetical protein
MRLSSATGLLIAGTVMVAGGCAAQPASPEAAPSPASAPTATSTPAACPRPTGPAVHWPAGVPAGVPLPPGSTIDTATTDNGIQRIRFHLPLSFRESVLLYLSDLPDNGFTVGTGDAEAEEADIPFSGKGAELSLQLRALPDPCRTEGVLVAGAAI